MWIGWLKNGSCYTCHQLGTKATREIPKQFGTFDSSTAAWMRRIQSGQAGGDMVAEANRFGMPRVNGDVRRAGPIASPRVRSRRRRRGRRASSATSSSRSGTGRTRKTYLHDQVSTDRRNRA